MRVRSVKHRGTTGLREECLRFGENRNYGVNGSPERGLFGRVLKKGNGE